MNRLRRLKVALLATTALISACTTTDPNVGSSARVLPIDAVAQTPKEPLRLVPQPEGTPLPPRDPSIADSWPPEIKKLIDNMLTLFPKNSDERPPSVKEVEQKMEITLTERPLHDGEGQLWIRRYIVNGTRYMNPNLNARGGYGLGESYDITRELPSVRMAQSLRLVISPKQSGFCLNPYELAVYTGSKFMNADTSPHANIRFWSPAYVWGMFNWSNTGRYSGQGFSVIVSVNREDEGKNLINAHCVHAISVRGSYKE